MNHIQHFLSELQRRKVLRVLSGYVIGAWIVLQVAVALQTAWALSAGFSGTVLNLMIIGLPVASGLAWFFDITSEGIKRTTPSGDGTLTKPKTTDLILAGALALVAIVAVWQFVSSSPMATTTAEAVKPKTPALGDKSIAVLPFKNMSASKEDAFFADGLTEETLNTLVQVRDLKVTSRTSSETFQGKSTPVAEIAGILGVRYILEGSVRRAGDHVRVTAQLIDTRTDTHLWSKVFEPKLEDVFAVQDDIARSIAGALDLEMKIAAGPRGAPTQNMEAYRLWLEAVESGRTKAYLPIDVLQHVIALDPKFAEPHISLAIAYANRAVTLPSARKDVFRVVKQEAARATELKPNFPGLHLLRGSIAFYQLKWNIAEQEFKQLLDFEPARSMGCMALAWEAARSGKFEVASRRLDEGQALDPLNRNYQIVRFLMAFDQGEDDKVETKANLITWAQKPLAAYGHLLLATIRRDNGDHSGAILHFRAYLQARGKNRGILQPVISALKSPTAIGGAIKALRAEAAKDPDFDIAQLLFLIDPAGAWLDEMSARIADGETLSVAFRLGAIWRLVVQGHGENPKLRELMRNAGLVDYWKAHGWPDRCRAKGEDDFECS